MTAHNDAAAMAVFQQELTDAIPHLRAFARSLCGNASEADDLVQETLIKAWSARERFEDGSSMRAWTFRILRNHFYSERRRAWRKQEQGGEIPENAAVTNEQQSWALQLDDVRRALLDIPDEQREALVLVGAGGLSYEEAAEVCGCAVGTVKSRVSRGRAALEKRMGTGVALQASPGGAANAAEDIVDHIRTASAERLTG
ncbi:MAG: sigma-70 family RNA polymerase sigma factor [Caulobacterales bacterium]|uniref:sigma-70 family RNA polymerase sigma factor n=1 Tax=Glycocaulis sp. TaxID=1969725 RepID=UPI003F9FBB18